MSAKKEPVVILSSFEVGLGLPIILTMYGTLIVMVTSTTTITMITTSGCAQIPSILQCIILEIDYVIKT